MTSEEWKLVEEKVQSIFCNVKLKVDGYDITLCLVSFKGLKMEIAVYVNGGIKGEDIIHDTDIRRRFYNKHIKSILTAAERKRLKKAPKAVKEALAGKTEYEWFEPYWQSFRSLKAHLIKNNTSIELVE